jgi:signal transduction histidine kinase
MMRHRFDLDGETLLRVGLLVLLSLTYVLVSATVLIAVALYPFGDPALTLTPPAWLLPYMGRFFLLDALLTILFGPTLGVGLLIFLVVLLTSPRVYGWLRGRVDDLMFGQRDDAFAVIAQINPHLDGLALSQSLLSTITATIAQSLKLPFVEIEALPAPDLDMQALDMQADTPTGSADQALPTVWGATRLSTFGVPPTGAEIDRLPLLYRSHKIGELRVSSRHRHDPLSASDRQVLHDLARQVGIALYAAQLTADLQRARTRLIAAREEERRRIRRDLHDGLGPTLATFAMHLDQARELLPPDAAASDALLAQLTVQAQTTLGEIRHLVYDLRPPDLDELGLVSALREYLQRVQLRHTHMQLDAPAVLPPLPAAVEVAAYRIVQEAVNNGVKHAAASEIHVRLALETTPDPPVWLVVTVTDTGIGIGNQPDARPVGIGLHSMRERAAELGGVCHIGPGPDGGTEVVARLPAAFPEL